MQQPSETDHSDSRQRPGLYPTLDEQMFLAEDSNSPVETELESSMDISDDFTFNLTPVSSSYESAEEYTTSDESDENGDFDEVLSGDSDTSNDSDDITSTTGQNDLKTDLKDLINNYYVRHNFCDRLLKVLIAHGHVDLPRTTRGLLGTVRHVPLEERSDMEYYYNGVSDQIKANLLRYPHALIQATESVDFSLNTDGIPLTKSSRLCSWPVLGGLYVPNYTTCVFPVALTCGHTKPTNLDFLNDTIDDLEKVLKDGVTIGAKTMKVNLRCILADSPAKVMNGNNYL